MNNKICQKCGTMATSNVTRTCKSCGAIFEKKVKVASPENVPPKKISPAPKALRQGKLAVKPQSDPSGEVIAPQAPAPLPEGNGKSYFLGKMLFASQLLDDQINQALDTGAIHTGVILNIRKQLGNVLRGSLPSVDEKIS